MTDISIYPRQDSYETTLASSITATDTTIVVSEAPSFALATGSTYMVIDPGLTTQETVTVTAVSGTSLTVTRGVATYEGGSTSAVAHEGGANIIMTPLWSDGNHIKDAVNSKIDTADGALTAYADAAARATAIPTPANGMQYYQTDTGKFYDYTGGSWVARESGGTFSNASTTVAGKVEVATQAEMNAGTETGTTGANLVASPNLDGMAEVQYLNAVTAAHQITLPSGMIAPYGGSSAPTGWLLCDGTTGKDSVSDTSLAALYAVIGTTYGGTGADDFDLPDLRERVPVGLKAGGTFTPLGDTGGAETHTLITAEMPAHTHTVPGGTTAGTGAANQITSNASTITSGSTGGDGAHNNLQPYLVVNYIIKK